MFPPLHHIDEPAGREPGVTVETLYEAVAQALAMVRGHDWVAMTSEKGLPASR
jgi:hypothetical protein